LLASLVAFFVARGIVSKVLKVLYVALIVSILGLIMSSFIFSVTILAQVFDVVTHFLSLVQSGGGSSGGASLSLFWGLLNAIGFISALNASLPLIISAISFVFLRILFIFSISALNKMVVYVSPLLT